MYDGGVIIFKKDFEETFEKFGASALPFRGKVNNNIFWTNTGEDKTFILYRESINTE